jgi:hypothetical protein
MFEQLVCRLRILFEKLVVIELVRAFAILVLGLVVVEWARNTDIFKVGDLLGLKFTVSVLLFFYGLQNAYVAFLGVFWRIGSLGLLALGLLALIGLLLSTAGRACACARPLLLLGRHCACRCARYRD